MVSLDFCFCLTSLGEGGLAGDSDEGVQLRIEPLNAG
jgi:hypothetical protein